MTLPISESDQPIQAGPAIPAIEDDGTPVAGAAVPVVVVSDGETRGQVTGDPIHVSFVTDRAVAAGSALPIVLVGNPFAAQDTFSPNADPLLSSATRTVTGNRWYSQSNMLYGGSVVGETVFGNSVVAWPALNWTAGTVVQILIRWEDAESYAAFVLGSDPHSTDPVIDGLVWLNEFGRVIFGAGGKRVQLHDTHYAIQPKWYLATFAHLGDSSLIALSTFGPEIAPWRVDPVGIATFPDATLKYLTRAALATTVTPYLTARQSPNTGEALRGHQAVHYRVQAYPSWSDSAALAIFTERFDGTGVLGNGWIEDNGLWERQNGAAICTGFGPGANYATHATDLSNGNAVWRWRVKLPAAGNFYATCILRQSGADYIRVVIEPSVWRLQAVQANSYRYVIAQGGYDAPRNVWLDIAVWTHGTRYLVVIDDVPLLPDWFEDTDPAAAEYGSYTGIGIGTFEANTFFDDVQALPHTVTLPAELQRGTMVPTALHNDIVQAFGAVDLSGVGDVVSVVETGQAQVRVRAHIQLPATVGRWTFIGTCLAYKDADNYFVVRLAADHDPVLGQPDDEIEVMQVIGGVAVVVGKVQFPRIYVDNAQFDLDTQIVMVGTTPVVQVYLDGDYLEAYPLPPELWGETQHGYYRNSADSGATITSGAVYA